jgi:ribosomal protein L40E
MGKFPEGDAEISKIVICKKCKTRNKKTVEKCRNCGSSYLRPKRKDIRAKK